MSALEPLRPRHSQHAMNIWYVVTSLIQEEVQRLVRRLLRRPEPPSPYAQIQVRRGDDTLPRGPRKFEP
jgi:hypothetical protein